MLVTDSVDVPQAAGVKKARIYGNAGRDVELRTPLSRGVGRLTSVTHSFDSGMTCAHQAHA